MKKINLTSFNHAHINKSPADTQVHGNAHLGTRYWARLEAEEGAEVGEV